MVRVSKEVFLEMFDMKILSNNGKNGGFVTCNRQHCGAKTHYIQENLYQKYLNIKERKSKTQNIEK